MAPAGSGQRSGKGDESASSQKGYALWRLQGEASGKTRGAKVWVLVEAVHEACAWVEESFSGETRQGSLSASLMDPARNRPATCRPPMTSLTNDLS
jgi:hypothetical protein